MLNSAVSSVPIRLGGAVVVVVVVGLQELHLLWYGLEHRSDPPSPLWYHRSVVGVENGHRFSAGENLWFLAIGPFG